MGFGGSGGCNEYFGEVEIADEGILAVIGVGSTDADCPTPEGVIEQEVAYQQDLVNAVGYSITDAHLEIQNADGETTLVYRKQEQYEMGPA